MSKIKEKKIKKPKSKLRKTIEWILTGVFLSIFLVAIIGQIDGMIHKNDHYGQEIRLGYATFIVQTDSMEPVYKVKSAIITYLEDADKIYARYQNEETIDLTFMDVYAANTEYTTPIKPENANFTNRTSPTNVPMTHRLQEILVNESVEKGEGRYTFIVAGINTEGHLSASNQYQAFTEKELLGRVVVGSAFLGGVFSFISSVFGLLFLLLIPAFYLVVISVIDIFKAYKEPDEKVTEASTSSSVTQAEELALSEEDKKRLKEELLQEMLDKEKGE
ncbi:MAG TPA: hypothetical protein GX010_01790 [Erysipelotrichaceae bacterium]|nr:hypothetical protein [Erysipelotrichaceae bacterium]